jgi:hypothetical protein
MSFAVVHEDGRLPRCCACSQSARSLPKFHGYLLPLPSNQKPEDSHLQSRRRENLKSHRSASSQKNRFSRFQYFVSADCNVKSALPNGMQVSILTISALNKLKGKISFRLAKGSPVLVLNYRHSIYLWFI